MPRQAATRFDAIVVGSGMTGGWAAKELTERGLRTLVLEAGRDIVPEHDYAEHLSVSRLPFRGRGNRQSLERDQFIQRECYACDEWAAKFFVNDRDNPYTVPADKPFKWIRGRQVGGRSITWLDLARAFVQICVLLSGFLAAIGITIFTRRELATAQK